MSSNQDLVRLNQLDILENILKEAVQEALAIYITSAQVAGVQVLLPQHVITDSVEFEGLQGENYKALITIEFE